MMSQGDMDQNPVKSTKKAGKASPMKPGDHIRKTQQGGKPKKSSGGGGY